MKAKDFLKKFESLNVEKLSYKELLVTYKEANSMRLSIDKISAEFKKVEDQLKDVVLERMEREDITTVKTSAGRLTISKKEAVATYDNDMFLHWLENNPKYLKEVLSKKPYTQDKIKEFDSDGELPPGLKWFKQFKLSITNK
jgi:hypothetical protein